MVAILVMFERWRRPGSREVKGENPTALLSLNWMWLDHWQPSWLLLLQVSIIKDTFTEVSLMSMDKLIVLN